NKLNVIDYYAHHPVEVANTIIADIDRYPNKNIIHVFQQHRYTSNRVLIYDWPKGLSLEVVLILLRTYSADELIIMGAESQVIV
ncbi:UDP-N-acetylmuramate--L-alanine ligase, partial [Francisella tularensis subsp. holarctica]